MKFATTTLLACAIVAASIGSARAGTIETVGVYDENTTNTNTPTSVSVTANNTIDLATLQTMMSDAFAANTGGVWNFDVTTNFPATASGGTLTLSYGTTQANAIDMTVTGGTSISSQATAISTISGSRHFAETGTGDRVFTLSKQLTLVAVTTTKRSDTDTTAAKLVATLQDNTTIETTAAQANNYTLHVLTATAANPIKSFKFDTTSSGFPRFDDLAFIVADTATKPSITSFTSVGGGTWELALKGAANTAFEFRSSTTLEFTPGTLVENLTQGNPGSDPGTISGVSNSVVTTDSNGDATVRLTLTGTPADFVRAQTVNP